MSFILEKVKPKGYCSLSVLFSCIPINTSHHVLQERGFPTDGTTRNATFLEETVILLKQCVLRRN